MIHNVQQDKINVLVDANKAFREGKLDIARKLYEQFINENPQSRNRIHFNLNLTYKRLGLYSPQNISAQQIVVYTVLVGDYESIKVPEFIDPDVRYILFTDKPDRPAPGWEVIYLDTLGLSPRRASRLPKLLPHRYLPDHNISLYIDASLTLTEVDLIATAEAALQFADLAAYPHYQRDCIYDEIRECLTLGKADAVKSNVFLEKLMKEDFPRNWGLLENAFLLRRNSPIMRHINEFWFKEYIEGPERDQFTLMYVLWCAEVPYATLNNALNFRNSPHVSWTKHKSATACAHQPDSASMEVHFDFLARLKPDSLVETVETVCIKLLKKQDAEGFPAVTSKLMRDAIDAITKLEMQNYSNEANQCRNVLSKTIFPDAGILSLDSGIKLAYIPHSALPKRDANNVHVMKMCSALTEIGIDVTLYAERANQCDTDSVQDLYAYFGTQAIFPIFLQDKGQRGSENLHYRLVRKAIVDGCTHIYTRSLQVALYATLADLPVIFEEHKVKCEQDFAYQRFVARSPALERIIVISQPLKRNQSLILNGLERKINVLHDAADPVLDAPPSFDLGPLNRPGRNIGFVGHLYPGKGAELCWELAKLMPDVSFHMLGGKDDDIKAWKIKSSGINNLIFHGYRSAAEVPSFISAVDICIAPFLRKVFVSGGVNNVADVFSPLKIFEYMAHGKPIVTTDLPVLREVLKHDETALLCDSDRPESFVKALNNIIADPAFGQRLGRAAKANFMAEFTWTQRARAVSKILQAEQYRIDPALVTCSMPKPVCDKKPIMYWNYGGEKQAGWAYGINARRLSSRISSLDHISPGWGNKKNREPEVVLAFDILIMTKPKFKKENNSRKVILRVGGPNPLKTFSGNNRNMLRIALAEADALIALSPQLCAELKEIHPSVHFIPNGIDTEAIRPILRQRKPGARFTVGMAASMSNEFQRHIKGYYFAIDACAVAGVELMVIGRGTRQIPHDRLLRDFWSQIDVLLHPVDAGKEASSNVIMEALAWGVPVITTRHAGFHGVALEHGREALVVRRTVADFANAIRALQNNLALRKKLSTAGRAFVEQHHSLDVVASAYESVVWQCLLNRSGGVSSQKRLMETKLPVPPNNLTMKDKLEKEAYIKKICDHLVFGFIPDHTVASYKAKYYRRLLEDDTIETFDASDTRSARVLLAKITREELDKRGIDNISIGVSSGLDSRVCFGALLDVLPPEKIFVFTYGHLGNRDYENAPHLLKSRVVNHVLKKTISARIVPKENDPFNIERETERIVLSGIDNHQGKVQIVGRLGGVLSGSTISKEKITSWREAKQYFIAKFSKKSLFKDDWLPKKYDPMESLPDEPFLPYDMMEFDLQLDLLYRQHQFICLKPALVDEFNRNLINESEEEIFLAREKLFSPFMDPRWQKSFLKMHRSDRVNQVFYKTLCEKEYPDIFPDMTGDYEIIFPKGSTNIDWLHLWHSDMQFKNGVESMIKAINEKGGWFDFSTISKRMDAGDKMVRTVLERLHKLL